MGAADCFKEPFGVLQAAGQAKVYSIGVDADQKDSDGSVIASALKKVDVATYTSIQSVVNGTFKGGALTFSIAVPPGKTLLFCGC